MSLKINEVAIALERESETNPNPDYAALAKVAMRAVVKQMREPSEGIYVYDFDQLDREPSPRAAQDCWSAMLDAYVKEAGLSDIPEKAVEASAKLWPDPTEEMVSTPEFEAVWQCIKSWDIAVPEVYYGYCCGATGNHVRAILDALGAQPSIPNFWHPIETAPKDGTLFIALSQDLGGNGLPPFVSLCSWHSDAGFCTDELREPTHWTPQDIALIESADNGPQVIVMPDGSCATVEVGSGSLKPPDNSSKKDNPRWRDKKSEPEFVFHPWMDTVDELEDVIAAKDAEIARLRDEYLYLRELFLIVRPLLKNVGDILDQRIDAALKGHDRARSE